MRICTPLVLWLALMAVPAFSQTVTSRLATADGRQVGEVVVGGRVALRMRVAAAGLSVGQRAAAVARRLRTQVAAGRTWQDVTVGWNGGQVVLQMGGDLLVTVDGAHAQLNGTTPEDLSHTWQHSTQTALWQATQGGNYAGADAGVATAVFEGVRALQVRDTNAALALVDPRSPARADYAAWVQRALGMGEGVRYEIEGITIERRTATEATVRVTVLARNAVVLGFTRDARLTTRATLRRNGGWRIWDHTVLGMG